MKFKENEPIVEEPNVEERKEYSIKDEINVLKKIINARVSLIQESIAIIQNSLESIDKLCNEIHD